MSPLDSTYRDAETPRATIGRPLDYLHEKHTLRSWFFTIDHKRIALLYLFAITFFFVIGAIAAGLVRLSLIVPNGQIFTSATPTISCSRCTAWSWCGSS